MRTLLLLLVLGLPLCVAAPLRVATYNVRLDIPGDAAAGNSWQTRKGKLSELIRSHGFEIVGLQEPFIWQIRDILAAGGYAYVGVGRDDGKEAGEHAPILYRTDRFRLVEGGTFWLSETPDRVSYGWDATKYHRICTWARLEERATGRQFQVWNVHFDHEAAEARRQSARLVLARIQDVEAKGIPVILMGDFNATPDSEPYRIVASALRDTRVLSAQAASGPAGTFNGFNFGTEATERIDHILVGRGIRVLRHETLTDSHDGHYPSDHFPVVTDLDW
jgi:endonuclease/exonuclease/phosphatase family metal-dependent hydrolase